MLPLFRACAVMGAMRLRLQSRKVENAMASVMMAGTPAQPWGCMTAKMNAPSNVPTTQRKRDESPGKRRPRNMSSSETGAQTAARITAPKRAQPSPAKTSMIGCDGGTPVAFVMTEAAIMPRMRRGRAASQPRTPALISRRSPSPRCNPIASRQAGLSIPRHSGQSNPMNTAMPAPR